MASRHQGRVCLSIGVELLGWYVGNVLPSPGLRFFNLVFGKKMVPFDFNALLFEISFIHYCQLITVKKIYKFIPCHLREYVPNIEFFQASRLFEKGESPEYSGKAVVYLSNGTYSMFFLYLPTAHVVRREGYVLTRVCLSVHT